MTGRDYPPSDPDEQPRRLGHSEETLARDTGLCRLPGGRLFCPREHGLGHSLYGDDGYFGRHALSRKLIRLDVHLLDFVSVAALLAAAAVLLGIAAARRCIAIGLIAVMAFGCAVIGAEILKHSLPWHALVRDDGLLERRFQTDTYPSGHATIGTSFTLCLLLVPHPAGDHG